MLNQSIDELAETPGANVAKSKRDFFLNNQYQMDYARVKAQKIPCRGGALESAVRRVITLRIKSNGKFWSATNIETMLLWCGYLKSDRLNDLCAWSRRFRTQWWTDSD